MLIHLKITKSIHDWMVSDLKRPHPFAYERVGFLLVRIGTLDGNGHLLLATDYHPVHDAHYINDPKVGAKINSTAIRSVMERAMAHGFGILHLHLHDELHGSSFSRIDCQEYKKLIPSFHNIGGNAIHGAVVLSGEKFTGFVQLSKNSPPISLSNITVVGFPIRTYAKERSKEWITTGIQDNHS